MGVASVVVTVNCCGEPADTVSGDDGFVVAPVGNPDIVTTTVPVNPLAGLTDMVAEPLELPSTALRDVGATATEKSGGGGGGDDPPPPPHAVRLSWIIVTQTKSGGRISDMVRPRAIAARRLDAVRSARAQRACALVTSFVFVCRA